MRLSTTSWRSRTAANDRLAEFLRVVSHRRVLEPPGDEREAIAVIDGLLESPTVRLLTPGERFPGISVRRLA